MFTTPQPTLTLQLHNFDLFRTCRTALLRGNWQDFKGHDASRGPSAIAELLVPFRYRLTQPGSPGKRAVGRVCVLVRFDWMLIRPAAAEGGAVHSADNDPRA